MTSEVESCKYAYSKLFSHFLVTVSVKFTFEVGWITPKFSFVKYEEKC